MSSSLFYSCVRERLIEVCRFYTPISGFRLTFSSLGMVVTSEREIINGLIIIFICVIKLSNKHINKYPLLDSSLL